MISFFELIPNERPPERASRDGAGQLPAMAHKCEPVRVAASLGWSVYLPMSFAVEFDGNEALVCLGTSDEWFPLDAVQAPGFRNYFNAHAPAEAHDRVQPFLLMVEPRGVLQIWTGHVVRTEPGHSLLVRGAPNLPERSGAYEHLEGVIDTDVWGGPLFTNVRLLRTGHPIEFVAHRPFLHVMPIRRADYTDPVLNERRIARGDEVFAALDWSAYLAATDPDRGPGAYVTAARKRRAAEERAKP